uniref:Uncharacterized protein n=1 Tax=Anopheles minimus TaxID=112268 RepID=A0A182W6C9_9DIPT
MLLVHRSTQMVACPLPGLQLCSLCLSHRHSLVHPLRSFLWYCAIDPFVRFCKYRNSTDTLLDDCSNVVAAEVADRWEGLTEHIVRCLKSPNNLLRSSMAEY